MKETPPRSALTPFNTQPPRHRAEFLRRWGVLVLCLWGARGSLAILLWWLNQGSLGAGLLIIILGPLLGAFTLIGIIAYYPWLMIAGLRAGGRASGLVALLAFGAALALGGLLAIKPSHIPGSEILAGWRALTGPAALGSLLIFALPLPARVMPDGEILPSGRE